MFGGASAEFIYQTMTAVEPESVQKKAFHKRHASVKPRFETIANERKMFISPSNMRPGLKDRMFRHESGVNSLLS